MRYAFLFISMLFATIVKSASAKKAPGYYVTNADDTINVTFRFEEARIASGIYRYKSGKEVQLTPDEAKLVIIDMGDKKLKFVSRTDIINIAVPTKTLGKGILKSNDTSPYPVFMEVYDDSGYVIFGSVDYYYRGIRYNKYVLKKGSNDCYFLTSMSLKPEMLKYFDDCRSVKQQIANTQKRNPPIKTFILSLIKTYNVNCVAR